MRNVPPTAEDRAVAARIRPSIRTAYRHAEQNDAWFMGQLEGMRADGYTPAERVDAYEPTGQ